MSPSNFIASSTTWKLLETTETPAALVLLGAGLTHPVAEVRHASLKSLIVRNSDTANMLILTHWNVYDAKDHALLRSHSSQFASAVRTLLSRGSMAIKSMMLEAISQLDLCQSVDMLLELTINAKHPLHDQAGECLLSMCRTWGSASRHGETRGATQRPTLVHMLHNELLRNPKNDLIMKAWLSVVHWEDGQQRSLLADTSNTAYSSMLKAFSETDDPGALQLLAGYFWRSTTPASILATISEQKSPALAIEMAKLVSDEQLEAVLYRLRTAKPLRCVENIDFDQISLDRVTQRRLLLIISAAREDIRWALARCTVLAKGTSAESRRLATEVLHWIRPVNLEKLISIMQDDSISGGQEAYRAIHEVLTWLKHPSVPLRKASIQFFSEFNVENLLKQINFWPARMCRVMAEIVSEVDTNKLATLNAHLASPAPKKRIAALQAVEYLNCASDVRDAVLGMLHDPRIEVRVRAIDTLSASNDVSLQELIPTLLGDANTDVVDAANRASKRFERMNSSQS